MRIPVLMYHKVSPGKKEKYRISPERFTNQMEYLSKKGYQTISPDDLLRFVKEGRALPKKPVLLIFDDGYKDNVTYAYPTLKKYNFRATIFLVTQYIGKKDGWSKGEEEILSWEEIGKMRKEGFFFGSHTHTHPNLLELSRDKVLSEIRDSKRILEERLKEPIGFFAYPYGKFNSQIEKMVKEANYLGAFSTLPGKNGRNEDPFLLRRILIRGYDTKLHFILNLKLGRSRI
ncbi:polysaccharide deacetylase family protein [bacterium]|nr:polysaccharide deacetylase family protein [bacterium]MBU4560786.1 polysaccharide deacetylase family protein [bacterium]MCG2677394.1 polysaccharide deacetylase family protein [bacterium]